MTDINLWSNATYLFNEFIEMCPFRPLDDTAIQRTDTSKIWGSPVARITWRNLTKIQKKYTVIPEAKQQQYEICSNMQKFIVNENVRLLISSSTNSWSRLEKQLRQLEWKGEAFVNGVEINSSELDRYNQMLVMTSPKNIVKNISTYKGDIVIFLFDHHSYLAHTKCDRCERKICNVISRTKTLSKILSCDICGKKFTKMYYLGIHLNTQHCKIPCYVCGTILWNRGNRDTPFDSFFSEFDEIPTRVGKLPKLFIRKFKDEISSPNATEWYFNLNEEERKIYTIITPDEEKWRNDELKNFASWVKMVLKRNAIESKKFAIFPVASTYPQSEREIFDIINWLHLYPDFYITLRSVFGHHFPLEIEIDAMVKFAGEGSLVSVFAGIACIENLLRLRNVDVKATDNYSNMNGTPWMEVENINAFEAINKYRPDVLFMSWPPPEKVCPITSAIVTGGRGVSASEHCELDLTVTAKKMTDEAGLSESQSCRYNPIEKKRKVDRQDYSDAFYALREFKGNKLIYVGDKSYCACKAFFLYLEDYFECVNSGITFSKVQFYVRK